MVRIYEMQFLGSCLLWNQIRVHQDCQVRLAAALRHLLRVTSSPSSREMLVMPGIEAETMGIQSTGTKSKFITQDGDILHTKEKDYTGRRRLHF